MGRCNLSNDELNGIKTSRIEKFNSQGLSVEDAEAYVQAKALPAR